VVVTAAQVLTPPQAPDWQTMPTEQSVPVPQRQPEDPQLSARVSQAAHAPPATPHWETEPVEQVLPAQQPEVQDVESHTHWLLKQRVPAPHAAPVPQRQAPPPQLLAVVASQL
jgi:hypothetical protein